MKTLVSDITRIQPFEEDRLSFTIKTPPEPQSIKIALLLKKNNTTILETKPFTITIEPFPELTIKTSLFPRFISNGENFEVQLFNTTEELVFSKKGLPMRNGVITVDTISDIIPGQKYRVVVLGYPYIPRQSIITFEKGKNTVSMKRLIPTDADGNGRFNLNDIKVAITHPNFLLRFIPWTQL